MPTSRLGGWDLAEHRVRGSMLQAPGWRGGASRPCGNLLVCCLHAGSGASSKGAVASGRV